MSLIIYDFDLLSLKGAYLLSTIFLIIWLYAYIYHLYRSQATGEVDYEKYSKLALQDSLDDVLIESCDNKNNKMAERR
ncbi:cytochrome c oxidase, cbb3-type, CcoQ subunit [Helicobacter trogontum]|uniref:Cytochrome c oxidase, cbb3-type, CcoQ subunit n=1 Tax=Helicobacter trogontum TaxID=50960 RepID=A0A4U8TLI7_9HELI|nr:cytochrome c oxidase, cbb3-type, CcoQ subunit [Helicobacter trogontum]MCI5787448.1 cytochrome c oxidase, cbb3-type, CcoQ subunit [Helicobacter trogontum]MDY5186313.1 cytochrome c oxidase, cbb3-type, CcoQ subunit [Helicobacter trogontum]TLD99677.1 cytochrome c oxidase, cbb3-type, CcoQ subunit [Helicobacter trogontum]